MWVLHATHNRERSSHDRRRDRPSPDRRRTRCALAHRPARTRWLRPRSRIVARRCTPCRPARRGRADAPGVPRRHRIAHPAVSTAAWEDVYRLHGERLYRFAYRLTGNPHDAADLVQETLVRALPRLERVRGEV